MTTQVDESKSLPQLWERMEWGDLWEDADLVACIQYARASKLLALSAEWRAVLPTAIGYEMAVAESS